MPSTSVLCAIGRPLGSLLNKDHRAAVTLIHPAQLTDGLKCASPSGTTLSDDRIHDARTLYSGRTTRGLYTSLRVRLRTWEEEHCLSSRSLACNATKTRDERFHEFREQTASSMVSLPYLSSKNRSPPRQASCGILMHNFKFEISPQCPT